MLSMFLIAVATYTSSSRIWIWCVTRKNWVWLTFVAVQHLVEPLLINLDSCLFFNLKLVLGIDNPLVDHHDGRSANITILVIVTFDIFFVFNCFRCYANIWILSLELIKQLLSRRVKSILIIRCKFFRWFVEKNEDDKRSSKRSQNPWNQIIEDINDCEGWFCFNKGGAAYVFGILVVSCDSWKLILNYEKKLD